MPESASADWMKASSRASCPAKLMLAGEYDVIDGGPALLIAVTRRATATLSPQLQEQSIFIRALQELLTSRFGQSSLASRAADHLIVDTDSFREGEDKLGLGSSAAALVSATALCLHAAGHAWDPELVLELATQAHGDAQATLGARGSGADVTCSVMGGCVRFALGKKPERFTLPPALQLVFPWTGRPAATAPLVAAVRALAQERPDLYAELGAKIRQACRALATATDPSQAISALAEGGQALKDLGAAARVALWLPVHTQIAQCAEALGGSAKPTGAGGGDLAVAAFASAEVATQFRREMELLGIRCIRLALDNQGVRLHP